MFFCGFISFSQDISIISGTVVCPTGTDALGSSKTISDKEYFIVDETLLREFTTTGSFTTGGTNYTPVDESCLCTTRVTNMGTLFKDKLTFNINISNWDVSNVISFGEMFRGAQAFNQDIGSWDFSKVTKGLSFENSNLEVVEIYYENSGNSALFNEVKFTFEICN